MDIWISPAENNVALVLDALRAFGFSDMGISTVDLSTPQSVLQLGYPPRRIDLLSSIDGVSFDDCFANRVVMRIDDVDVPVISVTDFRANKLATGRLKDLADVEALDQAEGEN